MTFSNDPTLRTVGVIPYLHHGFHIIGDADAIASSTGAPLINPANTVKSVWAYRRVDEDITLLSINPHMHLIGSSMTVWAQFPDLSIKVLVHIPQWDPRWQGFYTYKKPIVMPEGTRVIAQSVYDNTSSNLRNPNDPPQTVIQGPNATDAMMMAMMHYTAYLAGDESLVFDDRDHGIHYLDCDPKEPTLGPRMYDQIAYTQLEAGQIEVYDLTGRLVYQGAEYDLNRLSLNSQPYIFVRFSGRSVEKPIH